MARGEAGKGGEGGEGEKWLRRSEERVRRGWGMWGYKRDI
jgi:hypothetical protein